MRLSSIHDGDLETSYDADAACEGKVDSCCRWRGTQIEQSDKSGKSSSIIMDTPSRRRLVVAQELLVSGQQP